MLELFAVNLFTCKTMYNKTIIRFGFCDIQNNQGLGPEDKMDTNVGIVCR